jgi:general secretion pathway protein L
MALLKNVLGIDLGSHSLKAVEIRQSLRSFEAVALHSLPRPDEETPVADLVRQITGAYQLSTDHVVTALRGDRISSRRLCFPFGDQKKVNAAIPFEVEEDLPFDIDDCLIDWDRIRSDRSMADVVARFAPRAEVARIVEELAAAGCPPQTLEAEGLVLGNLTALFDLPGTRMLIDLGHAKSICCVLVHGRAVAARAIPVGGRHLTQAVAADRGLDLASAERVKCEEGLSAAAAGTAPRSAAAIDRLAGEIARTADSQEDVLADLGAGPIGELTLFGGSAQLVGIDEMLTSRTRIPAARLGAPYTGHGENLEQGSLLAYAPALALALRGTAQARTRTNFLQNEFAVRLDLGRYRRDFGWTAVTGGIALVLAIASFAVSTALELRRAETTEDTVAKLYSDAFPDQPVPDDPIAALRTAVREANDRADFLGVYPGNLSALDLLSEISKHIPENLDVVFEDLSIDRKTIRMSVYAKKFESADRLGAELAKFAPFARAQIGSIENDPKRRGKRFRVTISLMEPGKSA